MWYCDEVLVKRKVVARQVSYVFTTAGESRYGRQRSSERKLRRTCERSHECAMTVDLLYYTVITRIYCNALLFNQRYDHAANIKLTYGQSQAVLSFAKSSTVDLHVQSAWRVHRVARIKPFLFPGATRHRQQIYLDSRNPSNVPQRSANIAVYAADRANRPHMPRDSEAGWSVHR